MTKFKDVLHRLRKQYMGKQFTLAASLGCTEAAISFWENGRRMPHRTLLPHIAECFRASGAPVNEITELQQAYEWRRQTRKRKDNAMMRGGCGPPLRLMETRGRTGGTPIS